MGRHSEVGYYASRRGYYTFLRGKRRPLVRNCEDDRPNGPNYLRAVDAWRALLASDLSPKKGDTSVGGAVQRWLFHLQNCRPASTLQVARSLLGDFSEALGHVSLCDIKPAQIVAWIDGHATWGSTTRSNALKSVKACFAWNLNGGDTTVNPLAGYKAPSSYRERRRGKECYLPDDLLSLILAAMEPAERDFFRAMADTGARPAEIANARPRDYRDNPPHVFYSGDPYGDGYRHKTARSKKTENNDRVIFLSPAVVAIVQANRRRPYLFPDRSGNMMGRSMIDHIIQRVRRNAAVVDWQVTHPLERKRIIPYSFRHTYITNAIKRGTPIKLVADLCGTSVLMIERHYSHLLSDTQAMYAAYLRSL